MKALILAAGETHAADCPKPMLPIGDVPLLEQIISLLQQHGIIDIAINLHERPWSIIHHLGYGGRWGVCIHYSFEGQLLGSAGAAKQLEWYLDESFIVYPGDVYTEMNLSDLQAAHQRGGGALTMALHTVDKTTGCESVQLNGRSRVQRILETSPGDQAPTRLVSAGLLVVEPEVLADLPAGGYIDFFHDVIPHMLGTGQPVVGYPTSAPVINICTPEGYQKAQGLAARRAPGGAARDLSSRIVAPSVRNVFRRFTAACAD